MAGLKKIERAELVESGMQSEARAATTEQNVASGNDSMPSSFASSKLTPGAAASNFSGVANQELGAEQSIYYPNASCYNYFYPGGYTGASTQSVDGGYFHADGSYTGVQSDNGSMVYYMPDYNAYATGNHMGVDGQYVGQHQYMSSSGYTQHPVSYESEAAAYYSGNTNYGTGHTSSAKSNSMYSRKNDGHISSQLSAMPMGSRTHQGSAASSNFSKSYLQTQPLRSSSKVSNLGSGIAGGLVNGFNPSMKFSSTSYYKESPYLYNGGMNYRQNPKTWSGNDNRIKPREKPNGIGEFESAHELTCGPRANIPNTTVNLTGGKEELAFAVRRDQYNLQEFQTDYENAKFYIIKSYNEDNIHRCVKYGVWSSTPTGNKKLDTIYRNTDLKAVETGKKCPIFLFFSVNGSGQFVGLAEMIGPVDFEKDMDFWQLDKWSGFFPVKWHIIKDLPNSQLRHIVLANNENKPVTYTRDTQEVSLKQGLEMLRIFKSYCEKTSILDDFRFYENREKSNIVKRAPKPTTSEMEMYNNDDFPKQQFKDGDRKVEGDDSASSLTGLTKKLSLNDQIGVAANTMREKGMH